VSRDVAASIRQRLLNEAKRQDRPFQELLQYFAMERFLYRLSLHPLADRFVLKGALLLTAWRATQSRPTVDIDLSARTSNDHEHTRRWIEELFALAVEDDGVLFDLESLEILRIKEDADYEGVRVRFEATLARARVPIQIDIGFGDVITPPASRIEYPAILNLPAPLLWAYPKETVIAEKLEAMTMLGLLNSRLKDYFDIWLLASLYDFDGSVLSEAIRATFANRSTAVESLPVGLTPEFSNSQARQLQWAAFRKRGRFPNAPEELGSVVKAVGSFAAPVLEALNAGDRFRRIWSAGGPWVDDTSGVDHQSSLGG
jgi:hypothetical protein